MTEEISKKLVCVLLRVGIELWMEEDRAKNLMAVLKLPNPPQFIEFEGQLINRSDISGVFDALTMEERTRRKNGQWKCDYNEWHDKGSKCYCRDVYDIRTPEDIKTFKERGYWPLR